MLHFLIPLAALGARQAAKRYVSEQEEEAIAAGIAQASRAAVAEIRQLFAGHYRRALRRLSLNSALLLAAVWLMPQLLGRSAAVFAIALCYLLSIVHGLWQSFSALRFAAEVYRSHRLRLYAYLEQRIYARVYAVAAAQAAQQTDNLWHRYFGSRSAEAIAQSIARHSAVNAAALIREYVWKKGLLWLAALAAYYLLARFAVIPFLITQETRLSLPQVLLYPLVFTFDYFTQWR